MSLSPISCLKNEKTRALWFFAIDSLIAGVFITFTLGFILAFLLTKEEYNAPISMTYKFSKRVNLIKGKETWMAKNKAHALLARLDLINLSLPRELISNCNPKLLNKFWMTLFERL